MKKGDIENSLSAIILAAGSGTRMKPISLKISKALSPIVDKPIIERIVEGFMRLGIHRFIIVVKSENDPIEHYFLERKIQANLRFTPQPEALGSGHALMMTEDMVETDYFFVSACDNMVPYAHLADMVHKLNEKKPDAVLSLQHESIEGLFARSVVDLEGSQITKIIEKPKRDEILSNVMSLPLYICSREIFPYLKKLPLSPRGEYELPQALQMMIDDGKEIQSLFTDCRFDLTTPEDLLEINLAFLKEQNEGIISHSVLPENIALKPPIYIGEGCSFDQNCAIGPEVVISNNCSIGSGASLSKCLILEGTEVLPDQNILDKIFYNV